MGRREGSCLCCKEKRPVRGRGLCDACYEAARRAVNAGETTWAALEKKKLAKPGVMSAFRQAFNKKK
jgi:hypothetical protein